ncbi:MAG: hypothetical protein HY329_27800, partial [Chloroflexi bacterium]|nr:hypothetical protein [Chloroflexota bacterium]
MSETRTDANAPSDSLRPSSVALAQVGLPPAEYAEIERRLGRVPNRVELGMFGALWSE